MILLADSGSTKTEWGLLDGTTIKARFFTAGLNPYFVDSQFVTTEVENHFPEDIDRKKVDKVYFYGAGCSSAERCGVIRNGLTVFFDNAQITVNHDIYGAAVALFGNKPGIAMILGTGSNSCVYNGSEITANIPALGYILGDEGSGAFFGLQLVKDYLNDEMPTQIRDKFIEKYPFTREEILDSVYKKPFPNRFLASFAPFLSENNNEEYIRELVLNGFDLFFKRHILPYENAHEYNLGSVGSVGYFLSDCLNETAKKFNFKSIHIIRSPMEGLINFFLKRKYE
jgi:glucosamine kinase